MNLTSTDIKDMLLADSSLGLVFGDNLNIGQEPETPDNCVTIFDTTGRPPQLTLDGINDYYYPSVQIRVRNNSYLTGATLAHNIMVYLHGREHETWNSTLYTLIQCMGEPFLLDWSNNKARFVINFDIQRRT